MGCVPCQIPELLLAKTEGGGEESDGEKSTKKKSSGKSTQSQTPGVFPTRFLGTAAFLCVCLLRRGILCVQEQ